ncbi:MAG: hypothetical protein HYX84_06975 [Chloroflexi bacterium]|nr:hypothetical protein [Chloroflexota bacterium]
MLGLKPTVLVGVALVTVLIGGPSATLTTMYVKSQTPKAVTTIYNYDAAAERWVKTAYSVPLPLNEDGSKPRSSNTLIINVREDEPIKEILIEETLIIGGNEPLLEIRGHEDNLTGTGKLKIGELKFIKVDAEELDIDDTKVVRITMQNVVADDNELDIDVDIVNVVRILRGASSVLRLGISRLDQAVKNRDAPDDLMKEDAIFPRETGMRVDRIRILGPDSGKAFIERLVIRRTGVAGRIEVRDVEIQDLILIDVTLDDS